MVQTSADGKAFADWNGGLAAKIANLLTSVEPAPAKEQVLDALGRFCILSTSSQADLDSLHKVLKNAGFPQGKILLDALSSISTNTLPEAQVVTSDKGRYTSARKETFV